MEFNITKNICRACLTEVGSFQSIFLKDSSSGESMNISEVLSACASIQVKKGDGLPDQICSECSVQTVKLYLFKLRCERSDVILKKRLEKRKAENFKIKHEFNNDFLNKKLTNDFMNNEFKCKIDKEMWEKNQEKVTCKTLRGESKTNEFESKICQKSVKEDDLLTNQQIFKDIKEEIIDEDIEMKYNSLSPLLMESKESLFSSPKCDLVIPEKENLEEHITELNIKKEPKVSCDENLKRKQQLAEINSLLKNNPHGCDICFEGFSQKSELKKHMKTHTSTSKETGKQPSVSNVVCDKGFRKSYECDVCEKTFTSSSNLSCHRKIHTGEKPYECDLCRKTFSQLHTLVAHKRIHTGEKPYECNICKKHFNVLSNLTVHKRIHTGEKPYECEVCTKRFNQPQHLTKHNRIHTGEKPYECKVCKKGFKQFSNLTSHKRLHTAEKPFKCD